MSTTYSDSRDIVAGRFGDVIKSFLKTFIVSLFVISIFWLMISILDLSDLEMRVELSKFSDFLFSGGQSDGLILKVLKKSLHVSIGFSLLAFFVLSRGSKRMIGKVRHKNNYMLIEYKEAIKDLEVWKAGMDSKLEKVAPKKSLLESLDLISASKRDRDQITFGKCIYIPGTKIPIPETMLQTHIGISGVTGVGKSQLLKGMIDQIIDHGHGLLVIDYNGEMYRKFGRKGDKIICPFSKDTERIDLFSESDDPSSISSALIVDDNPGRENSFFEQNARTMFDDFMRISTNHEELYRYATAERETHLNLYKNKIKDASLISLCEHDRNHGSVANTLNTPLKLLPYLDYYAKRKRPFSISKWAEYGQRGNVFVIVPDQYLEILLPWAKFVVGMAFQGAMRRDPDADNKPLYVIGDEILQLKKIPTLQKVATNGRKYNLRLILTWQTESQWVHIYNKAAYTILNNARTKLIHNPGDRKDSRKSESENLGDTEHFETQVSTTVSEGKLSKNFSTYRKEKEVVSATEVASLKAFEFYVKLPFMRPVKCEAKPEKNRNSVSNDVSFTVPKPLRTSGLVD